eukprot:6190959-Pleurochrysis_carterae.AAC.3
MAPAHRVLVKLRASAFPFRGRRSQVSALFYLHSHRVLHRDMKPQVGSCSALTHPSRAARGVRAIARELDWTALLIRADGAGAFEKVLKLLRAASQTVYRRFALSVVAAPLLHSLANTLRRAIEQCWQGESREGELRASILKLSFEERIGHHDC